MLLLSVLGSVVLASQASALVTRSPLAVLLARQATGLDPSSLPAQCSATCTPILQTLGACASDDCLCTNPHGQSLVGCVDCLVALVPTTAMVAQAQSIIDDFNTGCATFNLAPLTLADPGGSSNSSTISASATVSISASSGSVTASTTTTTAAPSTSTTPRATVVPTTSATTGTEGSNNGGGDTNAAMGMKAEYGLFVTMGLALGAWLTL